MPLRPSPQVLATARQSLTRKGSRPALTDAPHGTAVDQLLRTRWAALQRAEARLAAGSYGRSVASGRPIPDERLEANPLAELTVQEAAAAERSTLEEPDNAAGLVSARHLFEVLAEADITPGSLGCAQCGSRRNSDGENSKALARTT